MPWKIVEEPHDTDSKKLIVAKKTLTDDQDRELMIGQVVMSTSEEVIPEWKYGAEVCLNGQWKTKKIISSHKFGVHAKEAIDEYWEIEFCKLINLKNILYTAMAHND